MNERRKEKTLRDVFWGFNDHTIDGGRVGLAAVAGPFLDGTAEELKLGWNKADASRKWQRFDERRPIFRAYAVTANNLRLERTDGTLVGDFATPLELQDALEAELSLLGWRRPDKGE